MLIGVRKFKIVMVLYSWRASSKLLSIDKVFRMFWRSAGHYRMMCWMVRSCWHLLHMGGGSLLIKNKCVKKECPISLWLGLVRVTSCRLFKL